MRKVLSVLSASEKYKSKITSLSMRLLTKSFLHLLILYTIYFTYIVFAANFFDHA